eukprot:scaffold3716_cov69-Cylindrotheca_fusiformis.AAC.39
MTGTEISERAETKPNFRTCQTGHFGHSCSTSSASTFIARPSKKGRIDDELNDIVVVEDFSNDIQITVIGFKSFAIECHQAVTDRQLGRSAMFYLGKIYSILVTLFESASLDLTVPFPPSFMNSTYSCPGIGSMTLTGT